MKRRIDAKRFPNFIRAQRERGPFFAGNRFSPEINFWRDNAKYIAGVGFASVATFMAVFFSDELGLW
jgi:hypothetical protein